MPRTVWRLSTAPYANLTGEGARRAGGRWNPKGVAAVYTADHPALCLAEYLAHVRPPALPRGLLYLRIEIPDTLGTRVIRADGLGADWREVGSPTCLARGAEWLRDGDTAILEVPSAVLPLARNIIINPAHEDAASCRVVDRIDYELDTRLAELLSVEAARRP